MSDAAPKRHGDNYHHGNLRAALLEAATDLARSGGPDAVVLREVARAVGVSPTAAYRHFANHSELVMAVKGYALELLASTMQRELAKLSPTDEPAADARNRLKALGTSYVRFALTESGLFRIAFNPHEYMQARDKPSLDVGAYDMLVHAVEDLVAVGVVPAERAQAAETAAWAAVHGLAVLLLDGPLRWLGEPERTAAIDQTTDVVLRGL